MNQKWLYCLCLNYKILPELKNNTKLKLNNCLKNKITESNYFLNSPKHVRRCTGYTEWVCECVNVCVHMVPSDGLASHWLSTETTTETNKHSHSHLWTISSSQSTYPASLWTAGGNWSNQRNPHWHGEIMQTPPWQTPTRQQVQTQNLIKDINKKQVLQGLCVYNTAW